MKFLTKNRTNLKPIHYHRTMPTMNHILIQGWKYLPNNNKTWPFYRDLSCFLAPRTGIARFRCIIRAMWCISIFVMGLFDIEMGVFSMSIVSCGGTMYYRHPAIHCIGCDLSIQGVDGGGGCSSLNEFFSS